MDNPELIEALNRIADAIYLLAQATAGQFDEDEGLGAQSLSDAN